MRVLIGRLLIGVLSVSCVATASAQQSQAIMIVIGDSIAEGVQSADANSQTQPFSFAKILANKLGLPLSLPLIDSGPFGSAGNTSGRVRIDPALHANNLAVSGADVSSALRERADAITNTETDLVLSPRLASQVEIAESVRAPFVVCWIGNNDVLSAVTSFDQLNATQMTPVEQFSADLREILLRLNNAGSFVVLANIPDVSDIAYLVDRDDLVRFLGSDYGLPAGHFSTVPAMILVKLGLENGNIFQNPDFVLDPAELATIRQRTATLNGIIHDAAAGYGFPVVDVNGVFKILASAEPTIFGTRLTARFLGGLFSLDGVHPSNLSHAILAAMFIDTINRHFGVALPNLTLDEWTTFFVSDPFIDKNGNGRVAGRRDAGLLETLGPILGLSGDSSELSVPLSADSAASAADDSLPQIRSKREAIATLKRLFRSAP
jgi:hypothetical protein